MSDVSHWSVFINSALINNFVLAYFLGLCPFFGVSAQIATATRMGGAVSFVMLVASVWINLVLCIFNFLPIPPLDGGRILTGLLPENLARTYASFERYGFIVILLLAFSGVLGTVIFPLIRFANNLLLA